MTLRARLLIALLALALIPTAVFTAFTLDQLGRATEHWVRPGVSRALDSGVEVSKATLARLDAVAISQADAWAAEWNAAGPAGLQRAGLRERVARSGFDFMQVYRRSANAWRLDEQIVPPGIVDVARPDFSAVMPESLALPDVIHGEQGALAAAAPAGREVAIALGWWMAPDFFRQGEAVAEGAAHYQQLGVVVALQRKYTWLLVAGLGLALVIVALVLSSALAREMSRPIGELSAALERIAADDLSVRVSPSGARELRLLGESFNTMAERLADAREALQHAEREAAWREVAQYVAHEIKSMLTPLGARLETLRHSLASGPAAEADARREEFAAMERSLEDLTRLAQQFSQYARLPKPKLEDVDLAALACSVAEGRGASASVTGTGPLAVRADRMLISRALDNLVLNAREASPPGSPVEVRVGPENGEAMVEVLDRGPGLPAGLRGRLFEPFVSTKRRGSGLGLALVRAIVQEHGGRIALEDREGGGARARVMLPLAG